MQSVALINLINWGIAAVTCLISVLSFFILFVGYRIDEKGSQYMMGVVIANFLMGICYFLELAWKGIYGSFAYVIVSVGVFGEYLIPVGISLLVVLYIFHEVERERKIKISKWMIYLIAFIYLLPLLENLIHPFIYYIDESNYFQRGEFFVVGELFYVTVIPLAMCVLFYYKDVLPKALRLSISIYMIPPLLAIFVSVTNADLNISELAMTISIFIMSLYVEAVLVNRCQDREKEIDSIKSTLVLSQMRPHFLYNALSSISQLCKMDPDQASEMTDRFAEFLAKNMTDIQRPEPVSFEKELEYINNYIAIEQMRFGDDLKVVYNIETVDFFVPPLVVQPLIENAIKHGLGGREDGGMITISTRSFNRGYLITIADDGVGFDQNAKKKKRKDERAHLGLISVRERISSIKGAELLIRSKVGKGTTAMLIIPQGYNKGKE